MPVLKVVFALRDGDDRPSLVSAERLDGLVEISTWRKLSTVEWFKADWDSAGDLILSGLVDCDSFKGYRRLVVLGHMWAESTDDPISGRQHDSGFNVEEILESEKA